VVYLLLCVRVEEVVKPRLIMHRAEYIALVGSFCLVGLEAVIRILTLALRMRPYFLPQSMLIIG